MKKQLLLGSALLAAISAFPQNGRSRISPVVVYPAKEYANELRMRNSAVEPEYTGAIPKTIGPQMSAQRTSAAAAFNWNAISGSMNIFGVLVSNSKCLQYNDELGVVTFVHRKSKTYQPSPYPSPVGAETGAIVAQVTSNWGATWDSTCIWNNNSQWARYPQGGVYNPVGNTNIANAYVVGTGPITQAVTATGWIGNFFASKQLNAFDNIASTATGAQQFIANTGPFGPVGKVDFCRLDFSATDDGIVRSLGGIFEDANGTTAAAQNFSGAVIAKGQFVAGTFAWSGENIIPPVSTDGSGNKDLWPGDAHMTWNEKGTVGYVWFIGGRAGATGSNLGWQPIVFKTTNSGNSWTTIPGIDFNNIKFQAPVLDHLQGTAADSLRKVPLFNVREDVDGTVDKDDRLHIMATVWSSTSIHPDSLGGIFQWTHPIDGQPYSYPHDPGHRPYIYDFYETSNGWDVAVVDSMWTEAPGTSGTQNGYGDNPWDADPANSNAKQASNARMQMSRTPGGEYIVYTWAESDTNFTNSGRKWNHLPNIKTRVMSVANKVILPAETNITDFAGVNPSVQKRAQMHNTSPKCGLNTFTTLVNGQAVNNCTITLPVKVSNNPNTPLTQLLPNTHYYTAASLVFTCAVVIDGLSEVSVNQIESSVFPNPAKNIANVRLDLKSASNVGISVMNTMGQQVKSFNFNGEFGANEFSCDLSSLATGVYLINVKTETGSATKKLILE